jgi:hypothetical protein
MVARDLASPPKKRKPDEIEVSTADARPECPQG